MEDRKSHPKRSRHPLLNSKSISSSTFSSKLKDDRTVTMYSMVNARLQKRNPKFRDLKSAKKLFYSNLGGTRSGTLSKPNAKSGKMNWKLNNRQKKGKAKKQLVKKPQQRGLLRRNKQNYVSTKGFFKMQRKSTNFVPKSIRRLVKKSIDFQKNLQDSGEVSGVPKKNIKSKSRNLKQKQGNSKKRMIEDIANRDRRGSEEIELNVSEMSNEQDKNDEKEQSIILNEDYNFKRKQLFMESKRFEKEREQPEPVKKQAKTGNKGVVFNSIVSMVKNKKLNCFDKNKIDDDIKKNKDMNQDAEEEKVNLSSASSKPEKQIEERKSAFDETPEVFARLSQFSSKKPGRGSQFSQNTRQPGAGISPFILPKTSSKSIEHCKELNLVHGIDKSFARKFMQTDSVQEPLTKKIQKKKRVNFPEPISDSPKIKGKKRSYKASVFKRSKSLKPSGLASFKKKQLKLVMNMREAGNSIRIQVLKKNKKKKSYEAKEFLSIKGRGVYDSHDEIRNILGLFPWFQTDWLMRAEEKITHINNEILENIFIRFFPFIECFENKKIVGINLKLNMIPVGDDWLVKVLGMQRGHIRLIFLNKSDITNCQLDIKPKRGHVSQVFIGARGDSETQFEIQETPNESIVHRQGIKENGLLGLVMGLVLEKNGQRPQNASFYWENHHLHPQTQRGKTSYINILDGLKEENEDEESGKEETKTGCNQSFFVDVDIQKEIFDHLFESTEIKMKWLGREGGSKDQESKSYFKWKQGIPKCYLNQQLNKVHSGKELKNKLAKWRREFEKIEPEFGRFTLSSRFSEVYRSTSNITKMSMQLSSISRCQTDNLHKINKRVNSHVFDKDTPKKKKLNLSQINENVPKNLFFNKSSKVSQHVSQACESSDDDKSDSEMSIRDREETFNIFLGTRKQVVVFDLISLIENIIEILPVFKEKMEKDGTSRSIQSMKINFKTQNNKMNLLIKSPPKVFVWMNHQVEDLSKMENFRKVSQLIEGHLLSRAGRIREYLFDCLIDCINGYDQHGSLKIKFPKMFQGKREIVLFNPEHMRENVRLWVSKLDKTPREKKSICKANSILYYMDELPNDSFLFSNSRMHNQTLKDTNAIGFAKPPVGVPDDHAPQNQTFTINEIKFEYPCKRSQSAPQSQAPKRYRVFLVTFWNFETYQEDELLLLFSDLENFFSCQCRRMEKYKIPSDLSLEMTASPRISNMRIKSRRNLKHFFNSKIVPIRNMKDLPEHVKAESVRNIMGMSTIRSKNYFGSRDLNSLVSIEEKLNPLFRQTSILKHTNTPSQNPGFLTEQSKANAKCNSDFSKKLYMSSRKILKRERNLSLLKTRSNIKCECVFKATEKQFDKFWAEAIRDNKIGTLIGILIKANVRVFRLDSRILN